MTPSFPHLPQAREYLPRGLPTPGAVAFGFYANNCLTGNALQPDLVSVLAAGAPLPVLSGPGLPRTLTPPLFLRLWILGDGRKGRELGLVPLPALGWKLPAGGGLHRSLGEWPACVEGWGEGEGAGVGWLPTPAPPTKAST